METKKLALNYNEQVVFNLRSLFNKRGYTPYKMSKFEEYDLYARNKDFLISDSIITFTDTNGKLMALKPDVTLSIIKNTNDDPQSIQKVYYNENVYRISKRTQGFKEIMQVGLECFGNIDKFNICEVLTLACQSLRTISEKSVLDISHLGVITSVFEKFDIPSYARKEILKFISEKNLHELTQLCNELELSDDKIDIFKTLASTSGYPDTVLPNLKNQLSGIIDTACIDELKEILDSLDDNLKSMVRIDFSVVSDTHYYNTIVFKGFIDGVPSSVLTGGQYDKLMQKMKRKSGAIGFAVYLDLIERLDDSYDDYDVDVVLTYSSNDSIKIVNNAVTQLTNSGNRVLACVQIPENLKYREVIKLNECEVDIDENDA